MKKSRYAKIIQDGIWHNNQACVGLLGLCPLLAISHSVINSLGLGIATTLILIGSNVLVSLVRNRLSRDIRLPVFVLIIASLVTTIELGMNAYFHELYLILGIFIPLIVTNCVILGRAEAFAAKNPIDRSFVDGLAVGLGFTIVLVILGGMREILGNGTLLDGADLMFGENAKTWRIMIIDDYNGFLLAILPPGAFICLGFLIALKNFLEIKFKKNRSLERIPIRVISD